MDAPSKLDLRARILFARRSRGPDERETAARELSHVMASWALGGATVAAYVPVGSEPGSTAMLDALLAGGARVLLPVAREPGPLRWAEYDGPGSLTAAAYGLREPTGDSLPPDAVRGAATVLVPALAMDRRGVRLGRGAGFYDRTLHLADPSARLIGVVFDDEVVSEVPAEDHDIAMTHVLTPTGGLRAIVALDEQERPDQPE